MFRVKGFGSRFRAAGPKSLQIIAVFGTEPLLFGHLDPSTLRATHK